MENKNTETDSFAEAMTFRHPSRADTFVAVPNKSSFVFQVRELDESFQDVDVLSFAPTLLVLGEEIHHAKKSEAFLEDASIAKDKGVVKDAVAQDAVAQDKERPIFAQFDISPEVVFSLDGRRLTQKAALEYLSAGIVNCVVELANKSFKGAKS